MIRGWTSQLQIDRCHPYAVATVLMAAGAADAAVLLVLLAIGTVLEVPQLVRSLRGEVPLRIVPFDLLPA